MTISKVNSPQLFLASTDSQYSFGASTHSQVDSRPATKRNKRVQFLALDEDNTQRSPYELDCDIKNELWWSPGELRQASEDRRDLAQLFLAEHHRQDDAVDRDDTTSSSNPSDTFDQKIGNLYKTCSTMNVLQVLRFKAHKELLSDIAEIRGLENSLSKSMCRRRKRHVQSVLAAMKGSSLLEEGGSEQPVVATKWAQSSRTSQILARVMAQLDLKESQL